MYRSDTFVREQEKKAALEKEQVEDDVFAKLEATISEEKLNSHSILQKMKMLREYAFTFISKIEDMEKVVKLIPSFVFKKYSLHIFDCQ